MKERAALWDNIRFLLIVLVVVGHFSDFFTAQSGAYRSLYMFMYAFHMPLFIFISGHFYRNEKIISKCLFYVSVGFLLKIVIYACTVFVGSQTTFSLFEDGGIPWFLFVIAAHTLITYLLRDQNKVYVLIAAVVLACFAGYDRNLGDSFYLSRTIIFFPFYWAGTMVKDETVLRIRKKTWVKIGAVATLLLWTALCIFALDKIYILRHLLTGRNPFATEILTYGPLLRLLTYLISALTSFAVIVLVPSGNIQWVSKMGSRSIDVYFWHWPVFLLLNRYLHIKELFSLGVWGKIGYLALAVLLTILLSQGGIISYPLKKIKEFCFNQKRSQN